MARARSDKSKDRASDKGQKMRADKADEAISSGADTSGGVRGENPVRRHSSQKSPRSTFPQARQKTQEEPAVASRETGQVVEQPAAVSNGHQGGDDDSAMHRRVAERAFILYQEDGCKHGNDWFHWFEAERQITDTSM
jgi:hypothetical protein